MPLTPPDPSLAPDVLRLLVGAAGALSLLFGARLYKPALFGAAFAAGAVGVFVGASFLPAEFATGPAALITALVAGIAVAIVAGLAHRVALVAIGAVVGAIAGLSLAAAFALPVWSPLVGAAVGALAFPWTLQPVLKVVTPVMGATFIAWAVGMPDSPIVLLGLIVLGIVVQFSTGGKRRSQKDEDE